MLHASEQREHTVKRRTNIERERIVLSSNYIVKRCDADHAVPGRCVAKSFVQCLTIAGVTRGEHDAAAPRSVRCQHLLSL